MIAQPNGERRLSRALERDTSIAVAATTGDAMRAADLTARLRPDLVLIDAALPDGTAFAATRRIMAETPTPVIVAIDKADADRTSRWEALRAGALFVVPNLPDPKAVDFDARCADLVAAVHMMAAHKPGGSSRAERVPARELDGVRRASIVAIAASTGGPAALAQILRDLPPDFGAPIVVTQHISHGFVGSMTQWLDTLGPLRVKVADDGEPLLPGTVYVAGDGRHLTVHGRTVVLSAAPPERGHRPSATTMFASVAQSYERSALAAVLTGMGQDGVDGLAAIHHAGGAVLAQDEPSSVVFGMPKAAIDAGVVDRVLPLDQLARYFTRAASGSERVS